MRWMTDTNTLKYSPPSHGDWGIVRVASLVPESHLLFVCPFACGRHGALGAIDQGFKHRLSYVYIDETDIITGYDATIKKYVGELLEHLSVRPRAVMIYVSCLDDLIGTDLDSLMAELERMYPDVRFRAGHMNPITIDTAAPPALTTQDAMFDFLNVTNVRTNSVNFIGNLVDIPRESELFDVLSRYGIHEVHHISHYTAFDDFQQMAQSRYNLLLSPIASLAAKNMQKKHGIPFLPLFASYDTDEIARNYAALRDFLGTGNRYDFSRAIRLTEEKIAEAREVVGDTPIYVSGVLKPFGLAAALEGYGFHVRGIVADEVLSIERETAEQLCACGKAERLLSQHPSTAFMKTEDTNAIAIGFDAAYVVNTKHIVDITGDQGMFGYHGVRKMMDLLMKAHGSESDLRRLISDYGVVV